MNEQIYVTLHSSADRLALEATRRLASGLDEADAYIESYQKVLKYLISEFKKNKVEP